MKAKLDVSERRVSELQQERQWQHPEEERWRAQGRERLLQEKVGGCPVAPLLCSVVSSLLPFIFLPVCEAERGLCTEVRLWLLNILPKAGAAELPHHRTAHGEKVFQYDWQTAQH